MFVFFLLSLFAAIAFSSTNDSDMNNNELTNTVANNLQSYQYTPE